MRYLDNILMTMGTASEVSAIRAEGLKPNAPWSPNQTEESEAMTDKLPICNRVCFTKSTVKIGWQSYYIGGWKALESFLNLTWTPDHPAFRSSYDNQ